MATQYSLRGYPIPITQSDDATRTEVLRTLVVKETTSTTTVQARVMVLA
jgi:hypothetical protein